MLTWWWSHDHTHSWKLNNYRLKIGQIHCVEMRLYDAAFLALWLRSVWSKHQDLSVPFLALFPGRYHVFWTLFLDPCFSAGWQGDISGEENLPCNPSILPLWPTFKVSLHIYWEPCNLTHVIPFPPIILQGFNTHMRKAGARRPANWGTPAGKGEAALTTGHWGVSGGFRKAFTDWQLYQESEWRPGRQWDPHPSWITRP